MTYQVTDAHGQPWPPGIKSELCDPASPRSIMPSARAVAARAAVAVARVRCSESGAGWGCGTVHSLAKPLLKGES